MADLIATVDQQHAGRFYREGESLAGMPVAVQQHALATGMAREPVVKKPRKTAETAE